MNKMHSPLKALIHVYDRKICIYQNGIISETGFAGGMSINKELVKNSNLLLASRFFGILAAESFTVRRRYNRFTWSFCDNKQNKVDDVNANTKNKAKTYVLGKQFIVEKFEYAYNFWVSGPFYPRKKATLISCFSQNIPCVKLLPEAKKINIQLNWQPNEHVQQRRIASHKP